MATLIRYKPNGQLYILLGTGYGMSATAYQGHPGFTPKKEQQSEAWLFVTGRDGRVRWVRLSEAEVVSVDGVSPGELLDAADPDDERDDRLPTQPPIH